MATSSNQEFSTEQGRQQLAAEILEALKGIRFGTVEITVHDGRVVQIDRRERFRYQLAATSKAA
ncbi:MAG TPA: YezD family protein [bacterium]|nr:YezD family protein [bacterium]